MYKTLTYRQFTGILFVHLFLKISVVQSTIERDLPATDLYCRFGKSNSMRGHRLCTENKFRIIFWHLTRVNERN